jgi:hypothetical protein
MKPSTKGSMTALALLLVFPGLIGAEAPQSGSAAADQVRKHAAHKEQRKKSMKAVQEERRKAEQLREPIIGAVQEGMGEVLTASALLDQGREKAALTHLQEAEGKLDTAVAANPNLMFATIDSQVKMYKVLDSNEEIRKELAFVEELLEEGDIQGARHELSPLRDEIVVTTTSLPLGTYPLAIKEAVAELANGNVDQAHTTIQAAMNTIIVSETVFPVSVLMAKDAVERASEMDKSKKEEVKDTLDFAQQQLQKAELLGYLKDESSTYEDIQENIATLKEEVEGKNQVEMLYSDLKSQMKTMWKNITG